MIPNTDTKPKNPHISWLVFSLLFLVALIALMFFTDPFKANIILIILFYALSAGLVYCAGRFILGSARSQSSQRQSFLLTLLAVGMIFLSARGLLFWWVGIIFTATIVLIEAFFLAN